MNICLSLCSLPVSLWNVISLMTFGHPVLSIFLALMALWYVSYRFIKSGPLTLTYVSNPLNDFIVSSTPALTKVYTPTPYLLTGDLQTCFYPFKRKLFRCYFPLKCHRQFLKLKDGGQLALDWAIFPEVDEKMSAERAVVAVVPGLAAGKNDVTINKLITDLGSKGYKAVLINQRGCSQTPLLVLKRISSRRQNCTAGVIRAMCGKPCS
eukprot:TRINITY_DN842_c0_g2_i14.p1 TRINITY_DN842_c0_g2~~TRINITY_DN842_c0_g2_i14.p1  ORF type:complete len:209 (+),score=43.36 TRINITY_DN842_c0_g2_i14:154-780(+)